MSRRGRRLVMAIVVAVAAAAVVVDSQAPRFADRVREFSEPDGYFDTDNLISNEGSYLHVIPAIAESGLGGGAYVGVGPDQNFSYIAQLRPAVAYIVDVRRDNLLLHLLFKALFELAPTRIEYLSLLTGRAPPPEALRTKDLALPEVIGWIERAPLADRSALKLRVAQRLTAYGVPLAAADLETIARFHGTFIDAGLGLRFQTHGRPPNPYYPTLRGLLMATDRTGNRWSYLNTEAAYSTIRGLQSRHAIVPVVGDLSGGHALAAIAAALRRDHQQLSAIYVSNVEDYLFRGRRFARFIDNLARLPRAPRALVIRSIFRGGPSVSEVQPIEALVSGAAAGRFESYGDLIYRAGR